MILTRSPLRISLGGGGTDLPSFYEKYGGYVVSAAIDKYIYVALTKPFSKGIYLKYSKIEKVFSVKDIEHKIFKEVLKKNKDINKQIELTTLADIPSGTGLGSSGSFTAALLSSINAYKRITMSKLELANKACSIEIKNLKLPVGKQDQFTSVYGGINEYTFKPNGKVIVNNLGLSKIFLENLRESSLMYFTGYSRSASKLLDVQKKYTIKNNKEMIENLKTVKSLGFETKKALLTEKISKYADILNYQWDLKKKRNLNSSNKKINEIYRYALSNGALGGKLIGAGGGGFIYFLTEDKVFLRNKMKKIGLDEVHFNFDFEGTKNLIVD